MDQGGKLFNNPKVCTLFEKHGFAIHPTGADASHQNGPVKQAHCTVAKRMRSFLVGSSVSIKFLPHVFKHYLEMTNVMPSCGKNESPVSMATGQRDNFTRIAIFGYQV